MAAYRNLVYETPGFTDYFFSATPIREIAELNIGSRPAVRARPPARHRGPARHPWGFSWGQCRVALPGWCGFGSAVEAFLAGKPPANARRAARNCCCSACTSSGRSSARCCPTWTWCWPRPTWASPRATWSWWKTKSWAKRIFTIIQAEWQRTAARRCRLITGEPSAWPPTRRWRARSSTASPTSTRSITCRSS
jgi:phosphoenolpyruvate carboxylase